MSQSDSLLGINDIEATELPDYRPLCLSAAIGLVMGLFSFLALLHPVLWFWPLAGALVSGYALYVLVHSERLVGRKAALVGLLLSLLFGAAAPARVGAYQWMGTKEARDFGRQWFEALLSGDVYTAHQMASMPGDRKPLDEQLPALYEHSADLRTQPDGYLKNPVISTLRALGPRAMVRHYATESSQTDGRNDLVEDVYAVTYEDRPGHKKSFFVKLNLWRNLQEEAGPRVWRVQSPEGGYKPKRWE
jgi:hypothetical protein